MNKHLLCVTQTKAFNEFGMTLHLFGSIQESLHEIFNKGIWEQRSLNNWSSKET